MDTIRTVLDCDTRVAVSKLNRHVFAKDDERVASIKSRMTRIKINGYGNKTPVTDLNTLAEGSLVNQIQHQIVPMVANRKEKLWDT